ncbi:MAG: hydantoinase/oxoprolinase family protein [Myxococcota bacterium]|nr:hydantoinase/oxoprolinase family protein [Myxococcota bacterium]
MSFRIGIDVGGTFTDFALVDGDQVLLEKLSSTPEDNSQAVMAGLEKLARARGCSLGQLLADAEAIVHGTTVADNTLIQMKGPVTGLLTTEGFRDELELRRGYKEDIWDVRLLPPPAIAPRRRRLTVPERVRADGSVHTPLDEAAARRAIERLARQGVESVAISLLFSFANPVHEQRLGELVAEIMPRADVSLSHRVLPRAPEFERTSTTVVNAYVGPGVSSYLDRLVERLADAGYGRELLVMQSSGGVMTREYLRGMPIRVLASGPAGGVIGGARVGGAKAAPDLLCVDMGGTSYDVSLVVGGDAPAQAGWNWHHRYLVAVPMIQVETLGAGGGSICRLDHGVLAVGPESAGAEPGPICYGRGGRRPTVTDAILVLGLLSPDSDFAGGDFSLSREGVDATFEKEIAGPLGCSVEEAAFDCWRIVNANMGQAVRRTTAGKGVDPRSLTLLAYGGNGPVFAAIQAEELGIERVLIPRASPTFSALGALAAPPMIDEERSYLVSAQEADPRQLASLWKELEDRASSFFRGAGFLREEVAAQYQVNLRYPGQNWSLTVDVSEGTGLSSPGSLAPGQLEETIERFHALHEEEYGYGRRAESPEITGVRLVTRTKVPEPSFGGGLDAAPRKPAPSSQRRANLGRGFETVNVYRGSDLVPGDRIPAPGIVEETFTTIVVYPGWEAVVDDAGDYQLQRSA